MESTNPTLQFVFDIMMGIQNGKSLSGLLDHHVHGPTEFHREISLWWLNNQNQLEVAPSLSTDHRKILAEILQNGIRGARIFEHLQILHNEIQMIHEQNTLNYLERLPFRLMLPLVLFFFPSILLLLFGPLLQQIYTEVF